MLNHRVIMRKNFSGIGLLLSAGLGFGQSPAAKQAPVVEFEVASIKPAQPLATQAAAGKFHVGMTIDGARVDIGSLSLADLIPIAFRVKPYQVSGPGWMSSERFDVIGKMPDGAGKEQVPEMLQALLADRFKLTIHRDNKDQAVYALVAGKNGSKLKEAVPETETQASADDSKKGIVIGSADGSQTRVIQDGKGLVVRGGQTGNMRMRAGPDGSMRMEASNMTMVALADALTRFVDRPVIDMTELKGGYQVTLDLAMADMIKAARVAGFAGGAPEGGRAQQHPRLRRTRHPIRRPTLSLRLYNNSGSSWSRGRPRSRRSWSIIWRRRRRRIDPRAGACDGVRYHACRAGLV